MRHFYLASFVFLLILPSFVFSEGKWNEHFPDKLLMSKEIEINPGLFITARELHKKIKSKHQPVLIDVRSKSEFALFKIPGSIKLPLYAIKTKEKLKSKFIILFNEGFNNSQLIRECDLLRKKGFDVFILYGGLNSWKWNKGRIEGDCFALERINKMPPSILFSEKKFTNWIIINASENQNRDIKKIIPELIHIPYSENPLFFEYEINKIVEDHKKKHENSQLFSLLVFNANGKGYGKIEKILYDFENLFFLKEGANGYMKFLKNQVLIWNRDKSKKISTKKCSSCP